MAEKIPLSDAAKAVGFPLKLTVKAVKAAGAKAYKEKRLSAQGDNPTCEYRDVDGRPCLVGAAMTDDQAAILRAEGSNGNTIAGLGETYSYLPKYPAEAIVRMQAIHDRWAQANAAVRQGRKPSYVPSAVEAELAKLLGVKVNK